MNTNILTIDPSVHSAGFAIWGFASLESALKKLEGKHRIPRPKKTYLLRSNCKEKDWLLDAEKVLGQFEEILDRFEVSEAYCELPTYMAGAHGATASGSLQKLCHVAGMFSMACLKRKIKFEYVSICDWKGTMGKKLVERRITKLYGVGILPYKKDEWDAIGIGLYKLGKF